MVLPQDVEGVTVGLNVWHLSVGEGVLGFIFVYLSFMMMFLVPAGTQMFLRPSPL